MLSEILDAADKRGETVLVTAYGEPFSAKSLTGAMAHWCSLAGLPKGLTLRGLRKSLGVYLAEAEASIRQLMDVLGHDDIDHAELCSREASQVRLAVQGMDRVVRLVTRKPLLGEPRGEPAILVGPEDVSMLLISLAFSWAKIKQPRSCQRSSKVWTGGGPLRPAGPAQGQLIYDKGNNPAVA